MVKNKSEIVLQHSWNCISQKTKLYTVKGDEVIIFFPGRWNFEEGPDFQSARISINGNIITGDIEIHTSASDWLKHGHQNDERYDSVILHIVQNLKGGDYPDISTILLPEKYVQETLSSSLANNDMQKYPYGYCASKLSKLEDNILSAYFQKLGKKRFFEKTARITHEILESGVESAFLKNLFDSCGYKKNREAFLEMFNRFSAYEPDTLTREEAIAILWGESGLLPDPGAADLELEMRHFVEQNWTIWWRLRKAVRGSINWHLSGVRPLNNPCRRLAALSVLFSKFGVNLFAPMLDEFNKSAESDIWKTFKKMLPCRDNLWDRHSTPYSKLSTKAAVLGEMRALDIMVNVILPFIYAYADIHSKESIKENALKGWTNLPACQQNIILKISSHRWLIPQQRAKTVFNSTATQQGAILVHKKFCEATQMDCAKCQVLKELKQNTSV